MVSPSLPAPTPPANRTVTLLVGLLCLIWGSTWLVIKWGLRDLPPFTSAGLRMAVAAVLMAGVARMLHRREGGTAPSLGLTLAMGVGNLALSYGIIYWCETLLPSGLVSLIWAVFPLMMAVCGHYFLDGERLRPYLGLGFVLGFAGVFVLFRTDVEALGPEAVQAAGILLLSPLVSAAGTTLVKRQGGGVSSLLLNRNGMGVAAVLLLGAAALLERDQELRWTPRAVLSLAYLSLVGTVTTFSIYYWLMRYAPATRLSLIAYVTPLVALLLGWALGGEPLTPDTGFGGLLILIGVALGGRTAPPAGGMAKRGPPPPAASQGGPASRK